MGLCHFELIILDLSALINFFLQVPKFNKPWRPRV